MDSDSLILIVSGTVSACKRQNHDAFLGRQIRFYLDQYAFKFLPNGDKSFALDAQGCGRRAKPIQNSRFNFQRRIIGIDALAIHVNSPVHPPKISFSRHRLLGRRVVKKQLLCGKVLYDPCNRNFQGLLFLYGSLPAELSNKLKMRFFPYLYGFDFTCNIRRFFNMKKEEASPNGEIGCRNAVCTNRKNMRTVKTNERKPGTRNFLSHENSCQSMSKTICLSTP